MVKISIQFSADSEPLECAVSNSMFMQLLHLLDEVPPIDASKNEVEKWHVDRVCSWTPDTNTAAQVLGFKTRKSVYDLKNKHGLRHDSRRNRQKEIRTPEYNNA